MRYPIKAYYLIAILLTIPLVVLAQDDDEDQLPGQNLTVFSDIQPLLQEAQKKKLTPDLPEVEDEQPELEYNLSERTLSVPFTAPEVRPLAMRAEQLQQFNNVFAKVGFGNITTPLVEVYLNSGRNKKYRRGDNNANLGAFVKYLSQNASRQDQQYSDLRTKAFADLYTNKVFFTPYLGYNRDGNRFYGYDAEVDSTLAEMDNKQIFNYYYGGTRFGNAEETYWSIDYEGKIEVGYLNDYIGQSEINPQVEFALGRTYDNGHQLNGNFGLDYTNFSPHEDTSITQLIWGINPSYKLYRGNWLVEAGVNLGTDDQGFYIYPDLYFERELVQKLVVFHASVNGRSIKNNYKTLSDENPFLDTLPAIHSSRQFGTRVGFRGTPLNNFSYNVHAKYNNVQYLPLFLNDTVMPNRFDVLYDTSTNILNLHVEAGYSLSEQLRFLASFDFFNYTLSDQFKAWHKPTMKFSLLTEYHITNRLKAEANIYVLNKMWARDESYQAIELPGVVDINIGASYKINDSFHIFANINNIASANYQKWYRYPSYGINGIGGIKMIF